LVAAACLPRFEGVALGEGGFDVGQRVPDLAFEDASGSAWGFRELEGQVVLLDISTMWCSPCQDLAAHTQETQEDYEAEGFLYLTVLQENVEGYPPTPADLRTWADAFQISAPVVADGGDFAERKTAGAIKNGQYPVVLVLDREGVVADRVEPPDDASVRAAIESLL
jgi:thiol-disulfide isomerase/thioredoxin